MELRLLVLRTKEIKKLADFYTSLGLNFDYHKHGNSPYHYSGVIGKTVVEIYPLTKSQTEADKNFRFGFSIGNFEDIIAILQKDQVVFTEPIATDFGFMTVVTDPDGRRIELYKE